MGNGAVKCSECFVRASLIPNIVTAGFSNMTQCCFDSSKTVESTTVYFVSFIIHKIKYEKYATNTFFKTLIDSNRTVSTTVR